MAERADSFLGKKISRRDFLRVVKVVAVGLSVGLPVGLAVACKDQEEPVEIGQPTDLIGRPAKDLLAELNKAGYEISKNQRSSQATILDELKDQMAVLVIFTAESTDFKSNLALMRQVQLGRRRQEKDLTVIFVESADQSRLTDSREQGLLLYQDIKETGDIFQLVRKGASSGVRPGTDAPLAYLIDNNGIIRKFWRGLIPQGGSDAFSTWLTLAEEYKEPLP